MKKILSLLLLVMPLAIAAQVSGTISGKIIDNDNKEPLGFVTVALFPQGSTVPTGGCSSNDDGTFTISNVKEGNYTLQFSFVGGKGCRVIGVSSAMAGEGKSLSAVNLAYSLSQLDKKVLLIDCDMR